MASPTNPPAVPQDALQHTEEIFRALIENASDLVTVVGADGLIRYESPSVERILGYRPDELHGTPAWTLVHPEDLEEVRRAFQEQFGAARPVRAVTYRARHRDGSWRVLESTGADRSDDPRIRGVVINSRDVTERVQAEAALQTSSETLRALVQAAPEAVIAIDASGGVTIWNPAAERIFGWTEAEVIGRPLPIVPEEGLEEHVRFRDQVLVRGEAFSGVEVMRRRKDGALIPISLSTAPMRDFAGRVVGVVSLSADITEKQQALAALRESQQLFRTVVDTLGEGIVITDLDDRILYTNARNREITGFAAEELLGRKSSEVLLPPQERDAFRQRVARRVDGHAGRYEMQQMRRDGSLIWVEVHGSPLHDSRGNVVGTIGAVTDVTERKSMEEALHRNEARFRSLIENTSDLVYILDPRAVISFIGHSVQTILGYPVEQVVGRSAFEFVHPDDQELVREIFTRRLSDASAGRQARVEVRLRHASGSWRVFEAVGTSLFDDPAVEGVIVNARDVTDRIEAEEANRRLAAIVESSSDAIISKSLDGAILSWNAAAARIYGYTAEEAVGRPISMLIPPELLVDEAATVFKLARGERVESHETVRLCKDGRRIHVSVTISPILDDKGEITSASIIARDISEAKRVEAELRASNERYYLAGRAAKDLIWDWDLRTNHVEWGEAIYTTFGYSREQVEPELAWWAERIHPGDLDAVTRSLHEYLQGRSEAWSHEYRFQRGDGSFASVLDRGYAVRNPSGAAMRMIRSTADVTEQKENERALRRAKEEAEAASRSKSEFLSGMSHELRTPLNSVIGFTNVLRKNKAGNLRVQDLAFLERIQANGMHLLGLINDILDLSKIEAGKMKVERAPVALDALVRETLEELQGSVPQGVELRLELPEALAPLETDQRKLKQILINLVGNALKFTEAGSVTARVEADPGTQRPLRIDIVDTGVGIPEDRLLAIFEAFEQGEGGTTRRFGGTGLGLAISSALAHLLGYRVQARSRVGEGSTFSVQLCAEPERPARPDASADHAALDEVLAESASGEFADRLVLIIDDDADSRFVLSEAISEYGCQILVAASGEHGIQLARQIRPDLITLDLIMPGGMSGWDTLQALKSDPSLCEIPVVVVSVLAEENRGSLFGAVDVLRKPPARAELQSVLRRNLGERPGRILVVDDEEESRLLIASCVQEEGVEIRTAATGREALNVLGSFTPDLIFLDLLMPEMDGVQLLAHLREDRPDLHPAIVVVTGKTLTGAELDRLRSEVAAVIHKGEAVEAALRSEMREVWRRRR